LRGLAGRSTRPRSRGLIAAAGPYCPGARRHETRRLFIRSSEQTAIAARAGGPEAAVNRYVVLYLVTLFVLIPIDFLFLGIVAKDFFTSQVGTMLGEIRLVPAILFYLLYVAGIVIFVNGAASATWQSTLLYGALFGLFCYATFDLTSLSLLKQWSWPVAIVDISWGACVTAVSSTAGLVVANWLAPKI
jgi:uncharacterized membrane protein